MRYPHKDLHPTISPAARLAETADIIGDVALEDEVNIWYGAVLRGDMHYIRIGARTNIQDNAVVHVGGSHPTVVGRGVTVGHGAIVHGCTVEDNCLIGMGAILLNGCVIGEGSLIAAGALVTQGTVIPPGSVVMGNPGKIRRQATDEDIQSIYNMCAQYLRYAADQLPLFGEGEQENRISGGSK